MPCVGRAEVLVVNGFNLRVAHDGVALTTVGSRQRTPVAQRLSIMALLWSLPARVTLRAVIGHVMLLQPCS